MDMSHGLTYFFVVYFELYVQYHTTVDDKR
jgi:hypothetical protein